MYIVDFHGAVNELISHNIIIIYQCKLFQILRTMFCLNYNAFLETNIP